MRKLIRKRRHFHKKCSVLIAKPHNIECTTDERTNNFIMKAFERGLAEYSPIESKLPELARNKIIKEFKTEPKYADKEHIFFLDDDSPPIDQFAIEYLRQQNKPVACGVTPICVVHKDQIDCKWSAAKTLKDNGKPDLVDMWDLPKEPFKAVGVGGTCMLIQRRVLEALKPPYQKNTFDDDCENILFSEDLYFSEKILKAGFDIWVYPEIQCHHFHKFDLLDVFAIARQIKEGKQ